MNVESQRIRQLGLIVQLEDGTVVQLHAKPGQCEGGRVTVERETEIISNYYGDPLRYVQSAVNIEIEGLQGYEYRVYRTGPGVEMITELTVREIPTGGGRELGT